MYLVTSTRKNLEPICYIISKANQIATNVISPRPCSIVPSVKINNTCDEVTSVTQSEPDIQVTSVKIGKPVENLTCVSEKPSATIVPSVSDSEINHPVLTDQTEFAEFNLKFLCQKLGKGYRTNCSKTISSIRNIPARQLTSVTHPEDSDSVLFVFESNQLSTSVTNQNTRPAHQEPNSNRNLTSGTSHQQVLTTSEPIQKLPSVKNSLNFTIPKIVGKVWNRAIGKFRNRGNRRIFGNSGNKSSVLPFQRKRTILEESKLRYHKRVSVVLNTWKFGNLKINDKNCVVCDILLNGNTQLKQHL